jgi:ribosomal protein S12 methylthiotransferase
VAGKSPRPLATLVAEAGSLAAAGATELNLVAQDTTAYGQEKRGHPVIVELLHDLAEIPGIKWLRLLYSHPARVTPELLQAMAANPKVCPYRVGEVQMVRLTRALPYDLVGKIGEG